ncbi:MAG TPA: nucleotidyltransferase family protein [Rhizomicrobium sp.]|nr:nucleotidyltransferase family protein [Rhizomicrobium sp.]
MLRTEALEKLRSLKPFLDSYHVRAIAVFGSVARDQAGPKSDIDVMVEFSEYPDLLQFVRMERLLSEKLGLKVDLVTKTGLHPRLKDRILGEAVYAYS